MPMLTLMPSSCSHRQFYTEDPGTEAAVETDTLQKESNSSGSIVPSSLEASLERKMSVFRHIKQMSASHNEHGNNETKELRKEFYSQIKCWLGLNAKSLLDADLDRVTSHMDKFESVAKEWEDSEEDEDTNRFYRSLCEDVIEKCREDLTGKS